MAKAVFTHYDRIYGRSEVAPDDLAIYQTPQFARLNRVSLSAIPTWVQPTGVAASKAEHSRGVRFLAKLLVKSAHWRIKKEAVNIVLAATLHDIGTPPFSHLSEPFQIALTGQNHEEFSRKLLVNTEIGRVIRSQGGNLNTILSYIEGVNPPLSDLVNGSIDLDNLDNTLRFGQSVGLLASGSYYRPERLVKAFVFQKNGQLVLSGRYLDQIKAWERCRHQVYNYLYSRENLAPAAMLTRALHFAHRNGELDKNFFLKTDDGALHYLRGLNPKTAKLIHRAYHWQFYQEVFSFDRTLDAPVFPSMYDYTRFSGRLSDAIAQSFKLPPEDVAAIAQFDKGFRKIHLPILGRRRKFAHQPAKSPRFMIRVYVKSDDKVNLKKLKALVKKQIATIG